MRATASVSEMLTHSSVSCAPAPLGPNGTVEVDVPLANIGGPAIGQTLSKPAAVSYVREGVLAAPLETIDSAGPNADYVLAGC